MHYFSVANDGMVDYAPELEGILSGRGTSYLTINGVAVRIDARPLGMANLFMDYATFDGQSPFTARLLPGQHFVYNYGGSMHYFSVANDGTVDYAPELEGILSGRGTSNLTINGVAVQIDARALGVSYLTLDYANFDATMPIAARLLPGQHLFYTLNSPMRYFTVTANGTIDYDPTLDGILSGRGTSTLTISNMIAMSGDAKESAGFDSSDLVRIFQAGQYEDDIIGNSTFNEGDWNGDGDFTTADLVLAFQSGRYVPEAVPEQSLVAINHDSPRWEQEQPRVIVETEKETKEEKETTGI
jgi:hypothetical protein